MFCDNLSYIFMFLSIATSNMVATSLAGKVSCEILSLLGMNKDKVDSFLFSQSRRIYNDGSFGVSALGSIVNLKTTHVEHKLHNIM